MSDNTAEQALFLDLLRRTDEFAVENVRSGRGGPFGASIHVYDEQTGEAQLIGDLAANAVLATGMGSAHAEDQAMQPEIINALREYLRENNADLRLSVVMSSSGESCPACHSKQEILSRTLADEGLLAPGKFIVNYGATYKDTAEVAQFNDEAYHLDMQKPDGQRMIGQRTIDISEAPAKVAELFKASAQPVAVVEMPGGEIIAGYENRQADLMATAEVSAIRRAARLQKERGMDTPWDLGGATLYSRTAERGPLEYAESQWANIGQRLTVVHAGAVHAATQEAPGISNAEFFAVIAGPYNAPGAAISVQRLGPFDNLAQHEWRRKLETSEDASKILYNGIKLENS